VTLLASSINACALRLLATQWDPDLPHFACLSSLDLAKYSLSAMCN
jgi:hypothetical protein